MLLSSPLSWARGQHTPPLPSVHSAARFTCSVSLGLGRFCCLSSDAVAGPTSAPSKVMDFLQNYLKACVALILIDELCMEVS